MALESSKGRDFDRQINKGKRKERRKTIEKEEKRERRKRRANFSSLV